MQIDFHHAATYVVARLAGFNQEDSNVIAYSSQYIDDSITSGFITYKDLFRYQRIATAHPSIDYTNVTDNNENAGSWQIFHFLPGNCGLAADQDASHQSIEDRLVCQPDSYVAKAMMASVIETKQTHFGLHRLGIASHTFIDTFAHQKFIGLNHPYNKVSDIEPSLNVVESVSNILEPVGHCMVNTCPDRPYLKWSYINHAGQAIERDNKEDFLTAVNRLFEEFKKYQIGNHQAVVEGMISSDRDSIQKMIENCTDSSGEERHNAWLNAIRDGYFSFGSEEISYNKEGQDSWKCMALGNNFLDRVQENSYAYIGKSKDIKIQNLDTFLNSDYKCFHDAARAQRYALYTTVFPRFGLFIG